MTSSSGASMPVDLFFDASILTLAKLVLGAILPAVFFATALAFLFLIFSNFSFLSG